MTTHKFNKALFEKTCEIKYIGEAKESIPMSETDAVDKMKAELNTLKKFQSVGSYQKVTRKYHIINAMTAFGWMKRLLQAERELESGKAK